MNVRQLGLPKFAFDNFDISSHTDIHRCRFICNFNDMVFVINLLAKIQSKVCTVRIYSMYMFNTEHVFYFLNTGQIFYIFYNTVGNPSNNIRDQPGIKD